MLKKFLFSFFIINFFNFFNLSLAFAEDKQVSLGIMPFVSRTSEINANQASHVTDAITQILNASPLISIVERERLRVIAAESNLNLGNNDNALKLGKLVGCKYILLGAITQLTQRYLNNIKYSQFFFDKDYVGESEMQESTAQIEARLIEVETGRAVLTFSQEGSAVIAEEIKDFKRSQHSKNELYSRAVLAAASRLGDKIRDVLVKESAMIISVNKNNIRINRGSLNGVSPGMFYKIYSEGAEIFDLNGKLLGRKTKNIAVARAVNVNNEFSNIEILSLAKPDKKVKKSKKKKTKDNAEEQQVVIQVHEGDKIEAVTRTEAHNILEKLK